MPSLSGLYIMSLITSPIFYPMQYFASSTSALRSLNLFFGFMNFLLFSKLYKLMHGIESSYRPIAFLPFLFFFNFLFYTDTISTCFVFSCFIYSHQNRNNLAALFGLMSILFRQNNIIWVAFSGAILLCNHLRTKMPKSADYSFLAILVSRKSKAQKKFNFSVAKSLFKLSVLTEGMKATVMTCYAHIFVGVIFVLFVLWNGSVALGDKENHVLTLNIPQMFYFSIFTVLFSPFRFVPAKHNRKRMATLQFVTFFVALSLVICYVCFNYSKPHPFLLADNRHYTFYIWKRLLDRDFATKVALCPIYALSLTLLTVKLLENSSIVETLTFLVCTFTVLIVSPLFEFRYFIVPTILVYIYCAPGYTLRKISVYFDGLMYAVINVVVIYVFLAKPFFWSHDPEIVQRFMW